MYKLFGVATEHNDSAMIYGVSYNEARVKAFINSLNNRFRVIVEDVIDTTLIGNKPMSMGKYDNIKNCKILNYKILSTEDTNKIIIFNKDNAEKEKKAKLRVTVEIPSEVARVLSETFLTPESKIMFDGTEFIKLINHFFKLPNIFHFDKTLDLERTKLTWNSPYKAFLKKSEYDKFVELAKRQLNANTIALNSKERKVDNKEIYMALAEFQTLFDLEQIGVFPSNIELAEEFEIIKRFGIRNKEFDFFSRLQEKAKIDYNGGAIINRLGETITSNYDLDAKKREAKMDSKIKHYSQASKFLEFGPRNRTAA